MKRGKGEMLIKRQESPFNPIKLETRHAPISTNAFNTLV